MKLTKSVIDRLPIPETDPTFYRDDEIRGFGMKVFPSGVKSFFLEKRINRRVKRITIGRYGELTPDQARKQALKLAGDIATGGDPVAKRRRAKLEEKTLNEAFADYLEARKDLKERTRRDMRASMDEMFSDWLDKPITRITPAMVAKRHKEFGEQRSEARANLGCRYLRAVINFARARYKDDEGRPLIGENPVTVLSETRAWYRVDRRSTVIKPHELKPWFEAVLNLPSRDIGDYFQVLILTGLRREEALNLKWPDVDLKGRTLTVVDPKNRRDHTLPMGDYLSALMNRRKAFSVSEYVFSDSAGRRISNFRYALAAIEKASGVRFTPHDLRRTFATIADSLDIPAYALKALMNHKSGADVTAGYVIVTAERLRAPMQKIEDFVLKAAGLKPTAEIVELKREVTV
ncbi:tyrosine-type recombinase/integrase [Methylocaldum szegediense]|uniref:Integrase n=1 Tax=Methylocaldum szegediense TaxID=73780 RepID=A0ABN8X0I7_9GAMM|nr:tyrosine-type recombinase/integrase [Methylocaldum szegediense]CAI8749537.1 Integrase [Methylocaldum szegediense]